MHGEFPSCQSGIYDYSQKEMFDSRLALGRIGELFLVFLGEGGGGLGGWVLFLIVRPSQTEDLRPLVRPASIEISTMPNR